MRRHIRHGGPPPPRRNAIPEPRITLIGGATASGKSAYALELAERSGAAIVNADSQQLYRGLEVLTAAPSADDHARARHLLYGQVDPARSWSVGRWLKAAREVLAEADQPLIFVGGTGLYFNALTRGLADIPPVPEELRADVQEAFDRLGEVRFRDLLLKVDGQAVARISPGDRQRLVRALGVALATGKSLSRWQTETTPVLAPGSYGTLVLERDRAELYSRCDARVDAMVGAGALEEVRMLLDRRLAPDLPAMKALGVRELSAHLRGETSLAKAVAELKRQTRQYAKRQLTWFRNQTRDWVRLTSDHDITGR